LGGKKSAESNFIEGRGEEGDGSSFRTPALEGVAGNLPEGKGDGRPRNQESTLEGTLRIRKMGKGVQKVSVY